MTPRPDNGDDENSLRGLNVGETALLRRELDRQYAQRLLRVEERLETIETTLTRQLHDLDRRMGTEWQELRRAIDRLTDSMQDVAKKQAEQAPAMETLSVVVQSGVVLRWMILAVVGALGALATVATAWEGIRKWFGP